MSYENKVPVRDLTVKEKFNLKKFLVKWEMVLVYILVLINVVLAVSRPGLYFANAGLAHIFEFGVLALGAVVFLFGKRTRHRPPHRDDIPAISAGQADSPPGRSRPPPP